MELLASVSEALTHSEIASRLGRTITEVFRMLVCLEERGYISRTGPDERYQLTLKLFEIVHHHHPLQRLITPARPLDSRCSRWASTAAQSSSSPCCFAATVAIIGGFQ